MEDPQPERLSLVFTDDLQLVPDDQDDFPPGVSASSQSRDMEYWRGPMRLYTWSLRFTRDWQPEYLNFNSSIESTPKTNFNISATRFDNPEDLDRPFTTDESYPLPVNINAWGEEVMMRVGELTPEGEIVGENHVSFTIDSGEMENRREAGLIQYSTMLGIGVALLTEAFVIFLALIVIEIGRRTWRRKKAASAPE